MREVVVAATFKVKQGSEAEAERIAEPPGTWFAEPLPEGDPAKGTLVQP